MVDCWSNGRDAYRSDCANNFGFIKIQNNMDAKEEIQKYTDDIKDLPIWLKYILAIFSILGTLGTFFGIYVTQKYPLPVQAISDNTTSGNATTTNISEMFNKATSLNSVLERQDFLKKYIGRSGNGQ